MTTTMPDAPKPIKTKSAKTGGKAATHSSVRSADTSDPLYKELVTIGTNERTLRPDRLVGYATLLTTPEVLRRAGRTSDALTLARHAHNALLDAIAEIVVPLDKEVAEAALCSTDNYEGLRPGERLTKMTGVSMNTFKYRRERAFAQIMAYLRRGGDQSPQPIHNVHHSSLKGDFLTRDIINFIQRASILQHAGLADLFCKDLDYMSAHKDLWKISREELPVPLPFCKYIFERYISLVYFSKYTSLDSYIRSALRTSKRLDADEVNWMFDRIRDATPVGRLTDLGTDEPPSSHLSRKDLEQQIRSAYDTRWLKWYPTTEPSYQSALAPLIAASGAIAHRMARVYGLDLLEIEGTAQLAVFKIIVRHYPFLRKSERFAGNLSLRQRAEAYLEITGPLLTQRAYTWYRIAKNYNGRIVDFCRIGDF